MRFVDKVWHVRYPLAALVLLQFFDILSTRLALAAGGVEGNPVMAGLLGASGPEAMALAKYAVLGLVFVGLWADPGKGPYVPAALVIMDVLYGFAVAGNFLAYGQLTGQWTLPAAAWGLLLLVAVVVVDEVWFEPEGPGRNAKHARR